MQEGQSVGKRVRSFDAVKRRESRELRAERAAVALTEEERRAARVALMAQRYEAGVDLFTGQQLRGQDAQNWLELQEGRAETGDTEEEANILLD